MKKLVPYLLLLVTLGSLSFCRNASRKDSVETAKESNEEKDLLNEDQSDFLVNVASAGMKEVELGRLAQEKGLHKRVKAFGKMMQDDHESINQEVKSLASRKQITLPASVSSEQQREIDDLRKLNGRDFDLRYMNMMVDDHEKEIRQFEDASENHKDSDIQTFAAKTLPKLRAHLDSARMTKTVLK